MQKPVPMASSRVTNGGNPGLLSQPTRVMRALTSVTSLGWDRGCVPGPRSLASTAHKSEGLVRTSVRDGETGRVGL